MVMDDVVPPEQTVDGTKEAVDRSIQVFTFDGGYMPQPDAFMIYFILIRIPLPDIHGDIMAQSCKLCAQPVHMVFHPAKM